LPLESLVSPLVGVVRGMQDVLAGPEDARRAAAWCESAFPFAVVGGGSGATSGDARAAAIGEAVERYAASIVDPARLVVATAGELGARAVDPSRFALFSERQYRTDGFPYARFDGDTRISWIDGVSLPDGEPVLVPAQLVHLARFEDEPSICRATSSGLACHTNGGVATLRALLELLERDAFMLTWKTRLSWPLLEGFDDASVRPTGLDARVLDLSAFWRVPIVAAVVRSDGPGGAPLGVGAAADVRIELAIAKALDEAIRVRTWASALRRTTHAPLRAGDVEELDDHIRFYSDPAHASKVDFLDGSQSRRHIRQVQALAEPHLDELCRRLARRGMRAHAVDVTSPDVREAGLSVVRVLVPELCALDVEHGGRLLGGRRLYEEPMRLGRATRILTEDDVNPDPHPFP
jgi:ribosomal protein S12 methylthiotransferase accessory factor